VELTFRPNPAIRGVEQREFCVGGPQVTPHVVLQQLLPPGARREVAAALEPGRYRFRALERPGAQLVQVDVGGPARIVLGVGGPAPSPGGDVPASPRATLVLDNATDAEQLVLLERLAWTDQAATAAEVSVLQVFRDLFASEALRPEERISVGSLALAFTDLLGSTRLYREIGDAPAFGRVMDHFDVLREAIRTQGGGIVKTMGDAVMAAFPRPAAALRAMLDAQARLASPAPGVRPLRLKAGIHVGPCITVTLNERLDYFGSIVNVAARLEGLSSGTDVVVSAAVLADPEVDALLSAPATPLVVERFDTTLRGFDAERFVVGRVRRRPGAPATGP
jgi:class 3 adenylate cyclase